MQPAGRFGGITSPNMMEPAYRSIEIFIIKKNSFIKIMSVKLFQLGHVVMREKLNRSVNRLLLVMVSTFLLWGMDRVPSDLSKTGQ